jgi:hypothetical protein
MHLLFRVDRSLCHMTTWCRNTLLVVGPAPAIASLKEAVRQERRQRPSRQTDLSLARLAPVPPDAKSAYRWRLAHWDTPWDVRAQLAHEAPEGLGRPLQEARAYQARAVQKVVFLSAPAHDSETWIWLRWQYVSCDLAGLDRHPLYSCHPFAGRYARHILLL